ncbi:helix-turn-helix domain-containing protein [Mucilaginibacter calamicampi]|uniref:Helix-turn-helix domain-containing protein n=1 Tax=Mucilaginibacter calamicampi TaxID=1302352 RepID=A0ABW2YUR3_9SPHI
MSRTIHVIANIRKLRESRRYSQKYMGSTLGVCQNAYGKIELGQTKLTVEDFLSIADTLGVAPEVLMRD